MSQKHKQSNRNPPKGNKRPQETQAQDTAPALPDQDRAQPASPSAGQDGLNEEQALADELAQHADQLVQYQPKDHKGKGKGRDSTNATPHTPDLLQRPFYITEKTWSKMPTSAKEKAALKYRAGNDLVLEVGWGNVGAAVDQLAKVGGWLRCIDTNQSKIWGQMAPIFECLKSDRGFTDSPLARGICSAALRPVLDRLSDFEMRVKDMVHSAINAQVQPKLDQVVAEVEESSQNNIAELKAFYEQKRAPDQVFNEQNRAQDQASYELKNAALEASCEQKIAALEASFEQKMAALEASYEQKNAALKASNEQLHDDERAFWYKQQTELKKSISNLTRGMKKKLAVTSALPDYDPASSEHIAPGLAVQQETPVTAAMPPQPAMPPQQATSNVGLEGRASIPPNNRPDNDRGRPRGGRGNGRDRQDGRRRGRGGRNARGGEPRSHRLNDRYVIPPERDVGGGFMD